MAARSFLARTFFPSLEKELSKSLDKEIKLMDNIMGPMLAPQVHSYQAASSSNVGGAFGASSARSSPQRLVRVARPVKHTGLFHD